MFAKDLIRSLTAQVERQCHLEDRLVSVRTDLNQDLPNAKVLIEVDGRVRVIEVIARDLGMFDGITIED